jgi:hypothetical protein
MGTLVQRQEVWTGPGQGKNLQCYHEGCLHRLEAFKVLPTIPQAWAAEVCNGSIPKNPRILGSHKDPLVESERDNGKEATKAEETKGASERWEVGSRHIPCGAWKGPFLAAEHRDLNLGRARRLAVTLAQEPESSKPEEPGSSQKPPDRNSARPTPGLWPCEAESKGLGERHCDLGAGPGLWPTEAARLCILAVFKPLSLWNSA